MPVNTLPSNNLTYSFSDMSSRASRSSEDILNYSLDDTIANNLDLIMLVKWQNQKNHDDNLRQLSKTGWDISKGHTLAPSARYRHKYFSGLMVKIKVNKDTVYLDRENTQSYDMLQPTGIAVRNDGLVAYASANKILFAQKDEPNAIFHTIENPLFARLHSVAFDKSGKKILTASSSLDMLYEIDIISEEIVWSLDAWHDMGLNENTLGQKFYRSLPEGITTFNKNPSSFQLKDNPNFKHSHNIINQPNKYHSLGLATGLLPVFINSIDYDSEDILATSFARGEAWRINKNGHVAIIAKNLEKPHGFHKISNDRYLLTDTMGESVIFLTNDFKKEIDISFRSIENRKKGLEPYRWLQYVSHLGGNIYCAVMTSCNKIILFNPTNKTRREIKINEDWGVQMVIAV